MFGIKKWEVNMIRNKEIKSIIIKIIIIGLLFLLIGLYGAELFTQSINNKIIERDFSIVGKLIDKYPGDEVAIISNITKEPTKEDRDRGREVLDRYGYKKDIKANLQPLLKKSQRDIKIYFLGFISLFIIIVLMLIFLEYKNIYKKVQSLSKASEKVMEGDFSLYLEEAGEGDFNILNHHFNQMSSRLEHSLEILKNEKVYLKDTISNISHQLKTPLSSLIVLNDIIISDPNMDEDVREDFLKKMDSQLDRMEFLILNLLKMARIEAGAIEFKREVVDLKTVVELSLNTLKPLLKDTEIKIEGNLDSKFIGDLDWTVEALINIIKNGVEHGRGKIWITLEDEPLFASIIVRDNGKGIDNKNTQNIFKRFFKGENSVKPDSIGIGLNLSKLIVEAQNGVISVHSKEEKGTEFVIRFLKNNFGKDDLKIQRANRIKT